MDIFYADLSQVINETIIYYHLEDKNYQELLDLDIIEYTYLIISQIHNINYELYEEIISSYLSYLLKDKNIHSHNFLFNDFNKLYLSLFKDNLVNIKKNALNLNIK